MIITTTITGSLPHTLMQIKAHLRVSHNLEDALIQDMYDGALNWVQARTRILLADSTLTIKTDDWLCTYQVPKRFSTIALSAFSYTDTSDATIEPSDATVALSGLATFGDEPADFDSNLNATFALTAAANEAMENVVLMLTAQWYENRGDQSIRGVPVWIEKVCGTYAYQSF